MMISPLPPPVPPVEHATARNAPISESEALLSHRLDKGVPPSDFSRFWRSMLPPRTGRPPSVAPERMGLPGKRQRAGQTGAPVVSGGAPRDARASEDARARDPPPSRQGLSRLGTHARVRHAVRAPRRDDPRGAGAGRAGQPGDPPALPEVPRPRRLPRRARDRAR